MHIGNSEPMKTEFWMVYGEGCGAPTYKHDTADSARQEAARLAERNPGTAFYVLKARYAVQANKPQPTGWKLTKRRTDPDDDGIPF
jgi:hypothetical protein